MSTDLQTTQGGALDIIRAASMDPAVDPEKLRALLAVKQDWERDEARKAFAAALAEFQARAPIIEKGDTAYDKAYARYDRIWRTVRGLMGECGLAISWESCTLDGGVCRLRGALVHRDGHSQPIAYDVPLPSLLKGQNEAQQMGSATTYAKRYCVCDVLNIVTGDDDDGNAAGGPAYECVTAEQSAEINRALAMLDGSEAIEAKMLRVYGAASVAELPACKLGEIMAGIARHAKKQGKA